MNSTLLCISLMLTGPGPNGSESTVTDDDAVVTIKKQVEVPAREAGIIDQLKVKLQDIVELGDEIAKLDQDLAELEVKVATVDHRIAEKEANNVVDRDYAERTREVAEATLEKSRQANRDYPGTVTDTEMLRLALEEERGRLSVEQANHTNAINKDTERKAFHTLQGAQWRLDRRTVKSPLKGMVVEIHKQEGEWVDPRDSIVLVVQLNTLRINARVDASKYGPELSGCKVEFLVDLPGGRPTRYHGFVVFVDPQLDAFNNELIIKADVDNHNGLLRPGRKGALTIYTGTAMGEDAQ